MKFETENCINHIKGILKSDQDKKEKFYKLLYEFKNTLNEDIKEEDVIEMLAQHLITKPILNALFEGYKFTEYNVISQALEKYVDEIIGNSFKLSSLDGFYQDAMLRIGNCDKPESKQKIIKELYEKFFKEASPKMVEKFGIVYTPIELVDFVIHSVQDVLEQEFNTSLGNHNVHIWDPFTGTGTFITRLLQSGLIPHDALEYKLKNEIHANEIMLLSYYIATINIEYVYHSIKGGDYIPFEGICLTDTFKLGDDDNLFTVLQDNSTRIGRQKQLDIRVIIGNPPYSVGQKNANDDNKNVKYHDLDNRIKETYVKEKLHKGKSNLYDSYIRAIRWGSDRLGNSGIMAFVTPASWLDKDTNDGMRKCIEDEFTTVYIFNLRGNNGNGIMGENSRKEGDPIFKNCRLPIAITVFIKNPTKKGKCKILYHDIGDYLKRDVKSEKIKTFKSIKGITEANKWEHIQPNGLYDWINKRDKTSAYNNFIYLGVDKKGNNKNAKVIFNDHSTGVKTNRDAWVYNYSAINLEKNIRKMIDFYNSEVERSKGLDYKYNNDHTKISWSDNLKKKLKKKHQGTFDKSKIRLSAYRPFSNRYLYYDKMFNDTLGQMHKLFPNKNSDNIIIGVSGKGFRGDFGCLMVNRIPEYHVVEHCQYFPLKIYNTGDTKQSNIFGTNKSDFTHGIGEAGLQHFSDAYPNSTITKDDIFYYIYGLLHSEDYREKYKNFIRKEINKIPRMKYLQDFIKFSEAGRKLAKLHLNYDKVDMYDVTFLKGGLYDDKDASYYHVNNMKHGKHNKKDDLTTIIYNNNIVITNIPISAYEYTVGNKSAIGWVMNQQIIKTERNSKITNNSNDYAIETMQDPAYPLKLLLRVITVSMKTLDIIKSLPKIENIW